MSRRRARVVKLRARFVLLTMSIVAIPVIIALGLGLVQWATAGFTHSLGGYTSARRWLDRHVDSSEPGDYAGLTTEVPSNVDVVIVDGNDRVIASGAAGIDVGKRFELSRFAAESVDADEANTSDAASQSELIVLDLPDPEGYVVARFGVPRAFEGRPLRVPGVVFPVVLLTPVIIISIWILRDIRRSIFTLRDAAVRISSGDLDFELPIDREDEFAEVTAAFETMRRTIREEYARRARFTMGVSHDLKTPLALIKGYAEAIEDGYAENPEALEKYIRIIRERSDLLQERITHLIEFLRYETGEWKSTLQPVRIGPFVNEIATDAAADAALSSRRVRAKISVSEETVVRLDPVLVRRALENLVHNALYHGGEGADVRIEAKAVNVARGETSDAARHDRAIRLVVANAGAALPAESLEQLSEPLYRGDKARAAPGFGLGLSIVRAVVESHGWRLFLDDSVAAETRFVIEIPVAEPRSP